MRGNCRLLCRQRAMKDEWRRELHAHKSRHLLEGAQQLADRKVVVPACLVGLARTTGRHSGEEGLAYQGIATRTVGRE